MQEGIVKSYLTFSVSASGKDLDSRFSEVIASMDLDTEGELVQSFTVKGGNNLNLKKPVAHAFIVALVEVFASPWGEAVAEWVHSCSLDDQRT